MKLLLTGCSGYVGRIIAPFFSASTDLYQTNLKGFPVKQHQCCDLRDIDAVNNLAKYIKPDVIIHAAGNKNTTFCEENEALAHEINVGAVENLINVFGNKVTYIYISSDYVFDGMRGHYSENDVPAPFTVYGHQKLVAENLFLQNTDKNFIIRLSALFDNNSTFCKFLRSKFQNNEVVECYDDVFYSPTYYLNFLQILNELVFLRDFSKRIFHCGGQRVSRFNFALMYAQHCGFSKSLVQRGKLFDCNHQEIFFLRPDLSLNNLCTLKYLNIHPMSLNAALENL